MNRSNNRLVNDRHKLEIDFLNIENYEQNH